MIRLRMTGLKEKCWAFVIRVALRAESLSGDENKVHLDTLKDMVRGVEVLPGPQEYPEDVSVFMEQSPWANQIFGGEPPVQSKIDVTKVETTAMHSPGDLKKIQMSSSKHCGPQPKRQRPSNSRPDPIDLGTLSNIPRCTIIDDAIECNIDIFRTPKDSKPSLEKDRLALGPKLSSMPPRDALLALAWAPPAKQTELPGLATLPLSNACQHSGTAEPTSGGGSSPQAGQFGDIGKDANSNTIDDITKRVQSHNTRKAARHGRDDDSEGSDDERPSKTQGKGRGGRGKARGQRRGRAAPQAAPTKKGKVSIKSEPPKKRKKGTPDCNTPKGRSLRRRRLAWKRFELLCHSKASKRGQSITSQSLSTQLSRVKLGE